MSVEHQAVINAQCGALIEAGLKDQLLLPTDALYAEHIDSWWSASSRLRPWCIVRPRNTEDVSRAVRAMRDAGVGEFAVRSGGHSHWAGGSSIQHGVTIDLGHLNSVSYDAETKLARIGAGCRWGDVYPTLEKQGIMVAGGRDAGVGVGGFLTGAGNSFYTSLHGFGCDSIINAEVVLADGSVVMANSESHPDLWKALKGASGNLGIVTRFDMSTFPAKDVWGGVRITPNAELDAVAKALVKFTDKNREYPESAILVNFTYTADIAPDVVAGQFMADTEGLQDSSGFEEILNVSETFRDLKKRPLSSLAGDYALPAGLYNTWFTLSFKNDLAVVRQTLELNEKYLAEMKQVVPNGELITRCVFQPLPKLFSDISKARGGNVLGLDKVEGNALLLLYIATSKSPEYEEFLHSKAAAFIAELDAFAKSKGAGVPWIYLNYADYTQDPLKSYGKDNIQFLRDVSKKYDPEGLFQKRMRSGFKIPDIE